MEKNEIVPKILTLDNLTKLVDGSSKKTVVISMNVDDFYNFVPGQRARSTKNVQIPKLCDVVEVKFVRGSRMMYFKCRHDTDEYVGVEFLISPGSVLTPSRKRCASPGEFQPRKKREFYVFWVMSML